MKQHKLAFISRALIVFAVIVGSAQLSHAQTRRPVKKYRPYVTPSNPVDTRWALAHSPWDFSGLAGLTSNPGGFGLNGRVAYRVMNSILEDVDDSLSAEVGIGFVAVTNTFNGQSVSYSLLEIPILARWDFRINDTKFIVGPNLGVGILAGSAVTVNNVSYSVGGVNFLIGGQGIYRISEKIGIRANVDFGGYTSFALGGTFFL